GPPCGGAGRAGRAARASSRLGELQRLPRRYTLEIMPLLGPDKDIPAPDVNTDGRVMAWLMDTLEKVQGIEVPGSVTGKPLSLGGTPAHAGATASGVVTCTRAVFTALDIPFTGSRAVLQGFGKV